MKKPKTMTKQVKEYISYKRKLGFQLRIEEGQLLNFAKHADHSGHTGPISVPCFLHTAQ